MDNCNSVNLPVIISNPAACYNTLTFDLERAVYAFLKHRFVVVVVVVVRKSRS